MKTKMIILLVLSALVVCSVPAKAQGWQKQQEQQEWSSSSMMGSGSAYSSTVTPVGSCDAPQMATTSGSTPRGVSGRRNSGDFGGDVDPGYHDTDNSPVGDPWILLLLAASAAVFVKRKAAKAKSEEVNN